MHLPVVQDAYEKLNSNVDVLKHKSVEQEEICPLLCTQLSNAQIEFEDKMACKEKVEILLQTLEKERNYLLKDRKLF